ncbi:hypothetical protein [Acerihabitans arboris]|uniref:Uncharacterized protein n=1 Tax=Acerihabitans arboris TaxID=2691583 RepID=A0A845SIQ5_9GAMM|nr:hypothetical protein [Acerihabitans arboris]NDL63819.1 hypothetical protein [Acerihabitans arboris]
MRLTNEIKAIIFLTQDFIADGKRNGNLFMPDFRLFIIFFSQAFFGNTGGGETGYSPPPRLMKG